MATFEHAREHLAERIRAARAAHTPLRIRGGGSKDFYGQRLHGDVLSTAELRGIVSYEPSELVVTVGAGTPLAELEALLAQHGQCLPFEPPHLGWSAPTAGPATVGGMVATGLAGPARASVGGVRDYVLGLHLLNGRGEHLVFGGQVMKNVAGYDVSRLMVGAMGTLGLLTEVSLKVMPLAPAEATLVFGLDQAQALEQLYRWGAQPLPLNASCWMPAVPADVDADAAPPSGQLLVRLRGAVAAVEAACHQMLRAQPGTRLEPARAATHWAQCRDQQLPFFNAPPPTSCDPPLGLWRLSLPPTAPVLALPWPPLVEWFGGVRWLWAPLDAGAPLQAAARAAGGHATLFVAPASCNTWAGARFATVNSAEMAIMQRLKASFDPHALFNPGRLFAAW